MTNSFALFLGRPGFFFSSLAVPFASLAAALLVFLLGGATGAAPFSVLAFLLTGSEGSGAPVCAFSEGAAAGAAAGAAVAAMVGAEASASSRSRFSPT